MICDTEKGGHPRSRKFAADMTLEVPYGHCGSLATAPADACNAVFRHDTL